MRKFSAATVTTVLFGTLAMVGIGITACSVSVTVTPADGGMEAAATPDSSTSSDGGGVDGCGAVDGCGKDASTEDVEPDVGVAYTVDSFKAASDTSLCDRVESCCGGLGAGGAPFNRDNCGQNFGGGFENITAQLAIPGVSKDNIGVRRVAANACVQALTALSCLNAGIPGTEYKAVIASCYSALYGKVPANGACHADIECAPGNYCQGGFVSNTPGSRLGSYAPSGGTCAPLKALGDTCDVTDMASGDNCSTRGAAETGNYCSNVSLKCEPLLAVGSSCYSNLICGNGACQYTDTGDVLCSTAVKDEYVCEAF